MSRKEAEQPYKGLLAEQQGTHAVDRKQALRSIAQEGWDERHHLALERLPLDVVHRIDHPKLPEEAEEFIRESPFIQPIYDINQWLGVQPPYPPRVIVAGGIPTQAFRRALCNLASTQSYRPPPSVTCFSAVTDYGP